MSSPAASDAGAKAKKDEQITFRFCSECSNMLYPKEDEVNHRLMFECRTCAYTEEAASTCIFRHSLSNSAGETAGVTQDVGSDPTVGYPPPLSRSPSASSPVSASTARVTCVLCGDAKGCYICKYQSVREPVQEDSHGFIDITELDDEDGDIYDYPFIGIDQSSEENLVSSLTRAGLILDSRELFWYVAQMGHDVKEDDPQNGKEESEESSDDSDYVDSGDDDRMDIDDETTDATSETEDENDEQQQDDYAEPMDTYIQRLPRASKTCPACGHTEAVFFQSQQRSAETGMKLFYVCCDCGEIFTTV